MIKINYAAHYADNEVKNFESEVEVVIFISCLWKPKTVFVIAINDEIFITDSRSMLTNLFDLHFNSAYPYGEGTEIHIQEYFSYEEAYKVALGMKEPNPLCYEPNQ